MKMSKKHFRGISGLLVVLVLMQSCVVYHSTAYTLDQAVQSKTNTKITDLEGQPHFYKYLTEESGSYYGVKKKSGEYVKHPLNPERIERVYVKNQSASTWVTVGLIVVPVLAVVVYIATWDLDLGSGWTEEL
jgi:hypothetical protein